MNIPRLSRDVPAVYDPTRRLFAAIAVTAIRDIVSRNASEYEKATARQFISENIDVIADLANVAPTTISKKLGIM